MISNFFIYSEKDNYVNEMIQRKERRKGSLRNAFFYSRVKPRVINVIHLNSLFG